MFIVLSQAKHTCESGFKVGNQQSLSCLGRLDMGLLRLSLCCDLQLSA